MASGCRYRKVSLVTRAKSTPSPIPPRFSSPTEAFLEPETLDVQKTRNQEPVKVPTKSTVASAGKPSLSP
jgi:hypothetical protein